ncbi:MAG: ATP phosphoribosyltransferase [Candidatus Alcyoniella australis]|nr:ATP phosphoribosyltransferase [Candidatus Alcyoniella australis]
MSARRATLALPSKGSLHQSAIEFLGRCGLKVAGGGRSYSGTLIGIDGMDLLFCRAEEVARRLCDGTADAGITGLDLFHEDQEHTHGLSCLIQELGFGAASLVTAVPQMWIDVTRIEDLIELAPQFLEAHGRTLRVGTSFPNLTRSFLGKRGLTAYALVRGQGAIEAMPASGRADLVVDLTSSGVTLAQNGLRRLDDGVILESQACLVGRPLDPGSTSEAVARLCGRMLATIEARNSLEFRAQVDCEMERLVAGLDELGARLVSQAPSDAGMRVEIVAPANALDRLVALLRDCGAEQVAVHRAEYIF